MRLIVDRRRSRTGDRDRKAAAPVRKEVLRRIVAGSKRGFLLACLLACCTHCASDANVCFPFAGLPRSGTAHEQKDWGALDVGGRQRVLVLTDFGNEPDDAQSIAEASDPPFWPEEITSQIGRAAERAGSSALVVIHRGNVVLE